MPGPRSTLQVEGTFRELVEELADYLDNLKKSQTDSAGSSRSELTPLLEKYAEAENAEDEDALENTRDEVLKVLVPASSILNNAPDKGEDSHSLHSALERSPTDTTFLQNSYPPTTSSSI